MKDLKTFAQFVRTKRLRDLAVEYLRIISSMNIPLVKLVIERKIFPDLTEEKSIVQTMAGLDKFLLSIEDDTLLGNIKVSLKQWEEDKLPVPGIFKNDIQPADLILIYVAQKKSLYKFLPEYAEDPADVVKIISELENFYMQIQKDAFELLFNIHKETERNLKDTEDRFNKLVGAVKEYAIFRMDENGVIKTWNEGGKRIKGYSADEIIGKNYSTFYTEEDRKNELPKHNLELAAKFGNYETEGWRVKKDGTLFWADVTLTAIYGNDGKLAGFTKVTHDNTEKRLMEENRQRLIEILEATPDLVGTADAKDRHVIYMNTAGRRMTGIGIDEDVSKLKIEDVNSRWPNELSQEEAFKIAARDGICKGECVFIGRNGQEIPVSMVLIAHKTPDGKVVRFSTVSRDITEQKRAEAEIKSVNAFLDSVLENIPNMVFVKDSIDLRFVRFNKAGEELLGYTKRDLIGKNDYDFFPKKQADFFTRNDQAVLEQNNVVDIPEEPIDTKYGQKWLHTKKIPILNKEGKPIYLLGISEDITEMRKAKVELEEKTKELQRSNTELEQFAYVASHDLQEPLRTVSSYVQLLANRYKNKLDKDADEFIDFAVDGSNRMRQLINSLLEYSRINRVKPFELIDLSDIMAGVMLDMKEQITTSGATIKYSKLPEIYGDNVLIGQLFQNLIGNALKFKSPERKPEIIIKSEKKGSQYLFSISDNGIGMQPEYWEKIFVIFQRLNSREKYPGTGIGLSICKKIVERHGGKIWVESEPGKGSTFFFTINRVTDKQRQGTLSENAKKDQHIIN